MDSFFLMNMSQHGDLPVAEDGVFTFFEGRTVKNDARDLESTLAHSFDGQ